MVNLILVDDISGFEGEYGVTEEGRVYSFKNNRFLNPSPDDRGYLSVILSKEGIRKRIRVHRLIALTFIHNPNNYPCVDHKDRVITNNNVNNLRWVTYKQNIANKASITNSSSQYKGVHIHKGKWKSTIKMDGKSIHLGTFIEETDAAVAFNNAVDRYFPNSVFHYKNIF